MKAVGFHIFVRFWSGSVQKFVKTLAGIVRDKRGLCGYSAVFSSKSAGITGIFEGVSLNVPGCDNRLIKSGCKPFALVAVVDFSHL